ncbi:hypothetical protein [Corynebacterium freiburgense]|uniref:hypothetical protein n=1 Tax=Corynebacterium freiburgense TaxID=556548 RepID=UPI00047CDE6F|nr:hypothetical protein [Corynebacterium freiburgense]WJZ01690.1 hypothetical protein CFREI_01930 [Corynebacterium freiburgense]
MTFRPWRLAIVAVPLVMILSVLLMLNSVIGSGVLSTQTQAATSEAAATPVSTSINPISAAELAVGIHPPKVGPTPPLLPPGAHLRDHVKDYFQPFDPSELFAAFETCTKTESSKPEFFNINCTGRYDAINTLMESKGLPPLGNGPQAEISFFYSSEPESIAYDSEECVETIDRLYRDTGDLVIVLEEPCTEDDTPFPGQWDARRTHLSSIQIIDRSRGINGERGALKFPTLTLRGFQSREAVESLMRHYGLNFEPLGAVQV